MQLWTFASGSSGNCFLLQSEGTRLLIECGRAYTAIVDYLDGCGVDPLSVNGILLTHAHGDHARSAPLFADAFRIPIYASCGTLGCLDLEDAALGRPIEADRPFSLGEVEVRPFAVPHDCHEPLGYRFSAASGQGCLTTDLGWGPDSAIRQFKDVDLLVIESNYDPGLLASGPYPSFLKRRVAGSRGHLSNAAAGAAIAACGDRAPGMVWLAHPSGQNNTPPHGLGAVRGTLK